MESLLADPSARLSISFPSFTSGREITNLRFGPRCSSTWTRMSSKFSPSRCTCSPDSKVVNFKDFFSFFPHDLSSEPVMRRASNRILILIILYKSEKSIFC
jgi:hypothetical protein